RVKPHGHRFFAHRALGPPAPHHFAKRTHACEIALGERSRIGIGLDSCLDTCFLGGRITSEPALICGLVPHSVLSHCWLLGEDLMIRGISPSIIVKTTV